MRKHRKPPVRPADETSAQLRARLRRFALATRDDATRAAGTATIPFPEHVTVLAGPLRRVRPAGARGRRRRAAPPEILTGMTTAGNEESGKRRGWPVARDTTCGRSGPVQLNRSEQMLNVERTSHGEGPVRPGHAARRVRP
jgi:hypothetical protein